MLKSLELKSERRSKVWKCCFYHDNSVPSLIIIFKRKINKKPNPTETRSKTTEETPLKKAQKTKNKKKTQTNKPNQNNLFH